MKTNSSLLYVAFAVACALTFPACKSKKMITKNKPAEVTQPVAAKPAPKDVPPVAQVQPAPQQAAPNYNFSNLQFDFDSSILRTSDIQYLDHITAEMKKSSNARFSLNGYASSEGTAEHNMQLSIDRANSVKQYLVNSGIDNSRLIAKGFGESNPIDPNDTEEGREKNRRVEVKVMY